MIWGIFVRPLWMVVVIFGRRMMYPNLRFIHSAIQEAETTTQKYKTDVHLDLPPMVPLIQINSEKMRMVFVNLIRNACQAIQVNGEITIKVCVKNKIIITLEDNGCGIPNTNFDQIFEPFFTTKPPGLGLGLMNAKNIIK